MLNAAAATDVATTVQGATVAQFETELASLTDRLFLVHSAMAL